MKVNRRRALALATALLGGVALASGEATAQAPNYKLLVPGKLSVALTGDMPGMAWRDGKLLGHDGEILQAVADGLGLQINPMPMEWSGAIAAVQAGRVDLIGGNVAWTQQRSEILSLTDPTAYFQNGVTQKDTTSWNTLKDLEGKKVGSITGFSFVPELRKIPNAQLSFYDTSDAALRDLLAGRIEAMVGDPPVLNYAIAQNPDWKLRNTPFTDNNPEFPLLTGVGRQYIFGVSKENKALADAMSAEIRKIWGNCDVRKIGQKYGQINDATYTPAPTNFRAGVDRPQDWVPPKC